MNTKLIVALMVVGVLAVTLVGIVSVSAQVATTPTPTGTPNNGFWGWMGRCLGFGNSQYYGTQSPAYANQPANITITDPNTGQTTTYQGYYGYGGCMRSFFP